MPDTERAISARDLFVARGPRTVLKDLSFDVDYGEILAVLGPNGSGKSTLLRAVSGLLPYSGDVWIASEPLQEMTARTRAARLSFVPQTPSLTSPLPVREVVAHGRYVHARGIGWLGSADRAAIQTAMRQADVEVLADRAFSNLSRGEQQRVMLARALCTGARILCLDEPTATLDVGHALELHESLCRLRNEGYALVVVHHHLADALRFCDRALLMSAEQAARIGRVQEVIRDDCVREVYGVHMRRDAGLEFDRLSAAELAP